METTEDKLRAALDQKGGCCEVCWTSSFAPAAPSDEGQNVYELRDGSGKVVCQFCELTAALKRAQAERAAWQNTAEQAQRNTEFYHGIVGQIGEMFGPAAKTANDGTVGDSVLALKVPELVAALIKDIEEG